MMALTLLRGPTNPDPESDQEEHWFTYSLCPHAGTWREGRTNQEALDLNNPARSVLAKNHPGRLPSQFSFIQVSADHVTLEAVKKAEKTGDVIVRLVERHGKQGEVTLSFASRVKSARECNLLEREESPVRFSSHSIRFEIKPYEIRTFKLTLN
jgi:alpha-mannosidase